MKKAIGSIMNKYQFPELTKLIEPDSIAVVGASDRPSSIGAHVVENLISHSNFSGEIYFISRSQKEIGGKRTFETLTELGRPVDVVIVVIPAVPAIEVLSEAAEMGCRFAIVMTSGFAEAGDEGLNLNDQLRSIIDNNEIRIYGPNCPGLTNLTSPIGMTFSPAFRHDLGVGRIGLATQGGGLGRSIIQNVERGIGFSTWASTGNEIDLQVADFIYQFANDDRVSVIGCLLEGISSGARFVAACLKAREVGKPVVAIKVGRSEIGARAAASHTASLTGATEVNSAVFEQLGVIEVDDLDELADIAALLDRKKPTAREGLVVFASSGGAGSLCADNVGYAGLDLAVFTSETHKKLREILPTFAAINNPVDTTSITLSDPELYLEALVTCGADPNVTVILVPIPTDYGKHTEATANLLVRAQSQTEAMIIPIWMSERTGKGYDILCRNGLIPMRSLRNMRKAVRRWMDHGHKGTGLQKTHWTPAIAESPEISEDNIGKTKTSTVLSEYAGKCQLAAAGILDRKPSLATTGTELREIIIALGGPAVCKIDSPDVLHKSEIGGVILNVGPDEAEEVYETLDRQLRKNAPEARFNGVLVEKMGPPNGLEMLIGITRDPQFGPVMTVGAGGIYVELFKDVSRLLLPIDPGYLRQRLSELGVGAIIGGARGQRPYAIQKFIDLACKVGDYVLNHSEIVELDLNPVILGREDEELVVADVLLKVNIDEAA